MAFWGIEVKPGKPFTHKPDNTRERLHISQATLGNGNETKKKSLVQCNVGNKSPVLLCSLFPEQSESCQLNLEFDEVDEVVFSVIGPRSVHLTGYYVAGSHHYKHHHHDVDSESYGEDIADAETERSAEDGDEDEDEYEDSFIDDDDPQLIAPSPVSTDGEAAEALHKMKPKNKQASYRRLKKKYQVSQSDEDNSQQHYFANGGMNMAVLDSESEEMLTISSLCKSAARSRKSEAEENARKETSQTINKEVEDGSNCPNMAEYKADTIVDSEVKMQPDQHASILHSGEVNLENGAKTKKKKKKQPKKDKVTKGGIENDFFSGMVLEWGQAKQNEEKVAQFSQDTDMKNEEDHNIGNHKRPDQHESLLHSAEVTPESSANPKKKKKRRSKKDKKLKTGIEDDSVLEWDLSQRRETKADQSSQDITLKYEDHQRTGNNGDSMPLFSLPFVELVYGIAAKSRKKKEKHAEEKVVGPASPSRGSVNREDKAQLDEAKGENTEKDILLKNEENQKQANDKIAVLPLDAQLGPENIIKPKRKRKRHAEDKIIEADNGANTNGMKKGKVGEDKFKADGREQDGSLQEEHNQSDAADHSANEKHSRKKKKKKMSKTQGNMGALHMEESKGIEDNNVDEKSSLNRTLSNVLSSVEELETRELDVKVASPRKDGPENVLSGLDCWPSC